MLPEYLHRPMEEPPEEQNHPAEIVGDNEGQPPSSANEMPFLDHLEELRWRLLKSLAALVLGAVVCFIFKEKLLDFLTYPYYDAVESLQGDRSSGTVEVIRKFFQKWFPEIAAAQESEVLPADDQTVPRLQAIKPMTFFFVYLQISFFGGLVLGLPVISYQLWRFIAPGMLPGEKRLVLPIAALSVLCFAIGALIAYWLVLPLGGALLFSPRAGRHDLAMGYRGLYRLSGPPAFGLRPGL